MNRNFIFKVVIAVAVACGFIWLGGNLIRETYYPAAIIGEWYNILYSAMILTASGTGAAVYWFIIRKQPQQEVLPQTPNPSKKSDQEQECESIMDQVHARIPPITASTIEEDSFNGEDNGYEEPVEKGEVQTVLKWKGKQRTLTLTEIFKNSKIEVHNALKTKLIQDIRDGKIKIKPTEETLLKLGLTKLQVKLESNQEAPPAQIVIEPSDEDEIDRITNIEED